MQEPRAFLHAESVHRVRQGPAVLTTSPASSTERVTVNACSAAPLLHLAWTPRSAGLWDDHRLTLPTQGNAADRVKTLCLSLVSDCLDVGHCDHFKELWCWLCSALNIGIHLRPFGLSQAGRDFRYGNKSIGWQTSPALSNRLSLM